eukprot:1734002-Rhodomonas_salina.1
MPVQPSSSALRHRHSQQPAALLCMGREEQFGVEERLDVFLPVPTCPARQTSGASIDCLSHRQRMANAEDYRRCYPQ